MDDPDPGCLVALVAFSVITAFILALGMSSVKVSYEKDRMWEEAVKRGYAEKVNHSGGEGYRWKESNENTTDR